MKTLLIAVFSLVFASACFAADQKDGLIGKWYCGDGTGYNVYLELRTDGTYEATWRGCLGVYGSAKGKWKEVAAAGSLLSAHSLVLTPSEEKDMMKGHLTTLFIIDDKSEITLLRKEDEKHRTNQIFQFRKQKEKKEANQ